MRVLAIAFIAVLAGCQDDAAPPDPPPISDDDPPPPPGDDDFVHDPGLEGAPFSLDQCVSSAAAITCLDVEYSVVDGTPLHLDLWAPPRARTETVPVIFYLHGGGWSSGSHHDPGLDVAGYVAAGYAVASVEYRLTLDRARQPSGVVWPMNLQDVKTAVRWFRSKGADIIDGDRIMAYGFSAGAHLAVLAAATPGVAAFEGRGDPAIPSTIRAAVALSPPVDFHLFVPENPPLDEDCGPQDPGNQTPGEAVTLLIGGPFDDPSNDAILTELSATPHVSPQTAPTLMFAGTCDLTVPYQGAVALAELARAQNLPQIETFVSQGATHGKTLTVPGARDRLAAFITDQLGAP